MLAAELDRSHSFSLSTLFSRTLRKHVRMYVCTRDNTRGILTLQEVVLLQLCRSIVESGPDLFSVHGLNPNAPFRYIVCNKGSFEKTALSYCDDDHNVEIVQANLIYKGRGRRRKGGLSQGCRGSCSVTTRLETAVQP